MPQNDFGAGGPLNSHPLSDQCPSEGLTVLRCRFHCSGVVFDRSTMASSQLLDFDLFPELPELSAMPEQYLE